MIHFPKIVVMMRRNLELREKEAARDGPRHMCLCNGTIKLSLV
jgi:hypothetical protein